MKRTLGNDSYRNRKFAQTMCRELLTLIRTFYKPPAHLVLCCPADLQSQSATIRYIVREYGQEAIFHLKPSVGTAICLKHSHTAPWNNQIFLLCTRASNKHPLLHETLHTCLTHLQHQLHQYEISQIHIPIYDPERSNNLLPT